MTTQVGEGVPVPQPVHFVGIGGAGMSGIARIMLARGVEVTGCDAKDSRTMAALRALGASVQVGHSADHLDHARTVVYSQAIRADNAELVAAGQHGLQLVPRVEALAALMAGRRGVAVAGTHGKTTTTSMLTVALQRCGADPSYVIGGDLDQAGSSGHHGTGDIFVAEADESAEQFLSLQPTGAVVTNVELDHVDHYPTLSAVARAFEEFVHRIVPGGFLVVCVDDPGAARLADLGRERGLTVATYGLDVHADVRVAQMWLGRDGAGFELVRHGVRLGDVTLAVRGAHNVRNATAAIAAGTLLGMPFGQLRAGLASFVGARRRFEPKGSAGGVRVFDSYDHHPTELRAVLQAARDAAGPEGRVVAVFQPHRYTRTNAFAAELGEALGGADEVVVMEVYDAGEEPIPGVSGATVAAAVPLPADRVLFEPSWSSVPRRLADRVRPGDVVLTLGAGDVTMIGPVLLDLLSSAQ
jgi:UDP-N-acetylmuramate--alanine ligase